jgi:hypothetical protein
MVCPPATSEAGASRPKSLAGAIFMVYPQKYKNCSTLVTTLMMIGTIFRETTQPLRRRN